MNKNTIIIIGMVVDFAMAGLYAIYGNVAMTVFFSAATIVQAILLYLMQTTT